MATELKPSTDLVVHPVNENQLWPESLDTPGYVPRHMKRSASAQFPVLEVVQRLLRRLTPHGGDLEKLLALIGLYQAIRPACAYLKDFLIWAFTVQVIIPENDAVARDVLGYIGAEVILKSRSRSAMLVTGGLQDPNDDYHRMMMTRGRGSGKNRTDNEVLVLPPIGTKLFWIGYRPFIFSRRGGGAFRPNTVMTTVAVDDRGKMLNAITVMTLGRSLKPLEDFTKLCHDFKQCNEAGTTNVFFAGGGPRDHYSEQCGFRQSVSKAIRKLDTIDMDEDVKADIVKDAEYYYSAASRKYFADCGIPYRRGYLFHGPPGTGKTSFSAALAGHLGCDIYHIHLASGEIGDSGLHRLFLGLPRKCVVVIEDIDSAGIGREHAQTVSKIDEETGAILPYTIRTSSQSVTLSGLLNAIDGNASQEGRLLIMTSNNPDALDAALVRPGRVDRKVHFGNMSHAAGENIFKRLIGRSAQANNVACTTEQINDCARQFADIVPANTFSPAQIQNFLQGCRGDPYKALADIEAWVRDNRPEIESSEEAGTGANSAVLVSDDSS
ncbi:P-loop containing nucleoside triphosphate hydrolase protein [Pyrenochaeta sp. DS3sAY3a]|nr:P-loop containing nucleoside triphosphate hydrolase protein [Pyrenochaeta sp. DS3sAY3a]